MADAARNKIAAQIIKAEMMGDQLKVEHLKRELSELVTSPPTADKSCDRPSASGSVRKSDSKPTFTKPTYETTSVYDNKVKKFIQSTTSLDQMFEQEKNLSASDEARMFLKTSKKFSREDMETKYFSQEVDDSQVILNKTKRSKTSNSDLKRGDHSHANEETKPCRNCLERISEHLIVEKDTHVYIALKSTKPTLFSMSDVVIRSIDHSSNSFVSSSLDHQIETEEFLKSLKNIWKSRGYRCLIMETFFNDTKLVEGRSPNNLHYQLDCLPIKDKHFEKARMSFKQALQACEEEWSMNNKLVVTDGKRIQRCLPKGLPYFWVCFDELTNGFGHIIESRDRFSRHFGYEVICSLLDKDSNRARMNQREDYREQFERCRNFKLIYNEHKNSQELKEQQTDEPG